MRISTKTLAFLLVMLTFLCWGGSGNSYAQLDSDTTEADLTKKFNDIKAKAEKGDINTQCWLAICYDLGLYGCKIDKPQAKELFQKVAKHADENLPAVQFSKGFCVTDAIEAEEWFRKAANQGFAPAQTAIGHYYLSGKGLIVRDYTEAEKWFRKAAEQGYAGAQFNLGVFYFNKAIPVQYVWDKMTPEELIKLQTNFFTTAKVDIKKFEEAMKWLRMAAEQGHAEARDYLAQCYIYTKDYEKTIMWWQKAAKQGYAEAMYNIGVAYNYGQMGLPQSFREAAKWYRMTLAADQEFDEAKFNLAACLHNMGGDQNDKEAVKLFRWLAKNGKAKINTTVNLKEESKKILSQIFGIRTMIYD
ncbi:MAG: sel1 repeat family protein [Planctomycetaceae bacterium]|nr:sel1 repeat family protein [Planctomycetaceae bacterium]